MAKSKKESVVMSIKTHNEIVSNLEEEIKSLKKSLKERIIKQTQAELAKEELEKEMKHQVLTLNNNYKQLEEICKTNREAYNNVTSNLHKELDNRDKVIASFREAIMIKEETIDRLNKRRWYHLLFNL